MGFQVLPIGLLAISIVLGGSTISIFRTRGGQAIMSWGGQAIMSCGGMEECQGVVSFTIIVWVLRVDLLVMTKVMGLICFRGAVLFIIYCVLLLG